MRTILWKKGLFLLRLTLPWIVAAGILYWLFQHYPIEKIVGAARLVNPYTFAVFAILYFLAIWFIDCFAMAKILSRFTETIHWRELIPARAATYLLAMVNYGAGQAALAYSIQRVHKVRLGDIVGVFTLITAMDLVWIVTLAFVGSFMMGDQIILGYNVTPTIRLIGGAAFTCVALHLCFWLLHWEERLKGRLWQRAFAWLRSKSLFRVFHVARPRDYLLLAAVRLPIHMVLVLSMYLLIRIFQGEIPLMTILGGVPVAILIGAIPISWGGFGTVNKALIDLLSPNLEVASNILSSVTPSELILAASLLWMFTNYLLKLIIGLCFLSGVTKSVGRHCLAKQSSPDKSSKITTA